MTFKFELMDSLLFMAKQRNLLNGEGCQRYYKDANEIASMISGLITAAEREAGNAKQLREDNAGYSAESTLNAIL